MSKKDQAVTECTIFLLGKAFQRANGEFQKLLRPFGLTTLQHLVLEGLWFCEGQTATELGKILRLDKSTLSGVLDRMEDAEWIVRKADSEDRRAVHLYPSAKAGELQEVLLGLRQKANEILLKKLSLEEQVLLRRMLADLL